MDIREAEYKRRIANLENELSMESDSARKLVIGSTINSLKSILFHHQRQKGGFLNE